MRRAASLDLEYPLTTATADREPATATATANCDRGPRPATATATGDRDREPRPRLRTRERLRAAVVAGLLLCTIPDLRAQSETSSADAQKALRDARKELDTLQALAEKESRDAAARMAEEAQAIGALDEAGRKTEERLRAVLTESLELEEKGASFDRAAAKASAQIQALQEVLAREAESFLARFETSLSAIEDPTILDSARNATSERGSIGDRLHGLLDSFEKALLHGRSVAVLPMTLRVRGPAGERQEKVSVLRLGLLGGYFARPARKEGGIIVSDPSAAAGIVGETRGLTREESAQISQLVLKPEQGATVPFDVTGGLGVASLAAKSSPWAWFRVQGMAAVPLLVIAALALLLCLERSIAIAPAVLGAKKRIKAVLALVRSGRFESAARTIESLKRPLRDVLGAAVEQRGGDHAAVLSGVESALVREGARLRARLGLVSLCGGLSILAGLWGTVVQIFAVFQAGALFGSSDSRLFLGGLAEAIGATALGIALAGLCFVAHALLSGSVEQTLARLESAGHDVASASSLREREMPLGVGGGAL